MRNSFQKRMNQQIEKLENDQQRNDPKIFNHFYIGNETAA